MVVVLPPLYMLTMTTYTWPHCGGWLLASAMGVIISSPPDYDLMRTGSRRHSDSDECELGHIVHTHLKGERPLTTIITDMTSWWPVTSVYHMWLMLIILHCHLVLGRLRSFSYLTNANCFTLSLTDTDNLSSVQLLLAHTGVPWCHDCQTYHSDNTLFPCCLGASVPGVRNATVAALICCSLSHFLWVWVRITSVLALDCVAYRVLCLLLPVTLLITRFYLVELNSCFDQSHIFCTLKGWNESISEVLLRRELRGGAPCLTFGRLDFWGHCCCPLCPLQGPSWTIPKGSWCRRPRQGPEQFGSYMFRIPIPLFIA